MAIVIAGLLILGGLTGWLASSIVPSRWGRRVDVVAGAVGGPLGGYAALGASGIRATALDANGVCAVVFGALLGAVFQIAIQRAARNTTAPRIGLDAEFHPFDDVDVHRRPASRRVQFRRCRRAIHRRERQPAP